ncbi:hypothetical protein M9Y10_035085 [Tritrichomonas musculus]|uniref:Trafficking protein particle complex subunit 11 domain-containing protein n=1 Tax=Tritrichomonas musculus TaxID=1915356 RepID=A0ABR2KIQ4_9EUKA
MIDPKTYVPQRFSPLFAIIVDDDVNKIMKPSNLNFIELFTALAIKECIRVVPMEQVRQTDFEDFYRKLLQKTTSYSESFSTVEFEENDTTQPLFSPYTGSTVTALHYPSKESMNPPWCQFAFTTLYKSEQFSNFNFCDQPQCVLYVTNANKTPLSEQIIRSSLIFPEWMTEFVENIPIINIAIYDGLTQEKYPKIDNLGFFDVFCIPFRTRQQGAPGGIDPVDLRNLFHNDSSILNRENVGEFMTETDLNNFTQVINSVAARVKTSLSLQIQSLETENNNNKQFKNKVNRFFHKKNSVDRTTRYLNVPWRKIIRLQLGCYYLISQRYKESRKMLKQFIKTIKDNFLDLKLYTQFLRGMAAQQMPDHEKQFREDIMSVLNNSLSNNLLFDIYVPLIIGEFRLKQANFPVAINLYEEIKKKFVKKIPNDYRPLINALVEERLAGIYMLDNRPRLSLLYTSTAAQNYLTCDQTNHALRCLIWLIRGLPHDSWQYLYQNATLIKAEILLSLSQAQRSLKEYQFLLSLPDLSQLLQRKVITEFWVPFNDPKGSGAVIRLNSLLEVKKLLLIDTSQPEYWNLKRSQFSDFLETFFEFMKREQKVKITMAEWFDTNDGPLGQNLPGSSNIISVGNPVYISIDLYNRFVFTINLSKANFSVEYEGNVSNDTENDNYSIQFLGKIEDIKGLSTSRLTFKFIPRVEGNFKINKFFKNYWGSAETEVDCGPLTFCAKNDVPLLTMSFQDFNDEFPAYGVMRFSVVIKNSSSYSTVNSFYLAFDNSDLIISDTEKGERMGMFTFINIKKQLLPGQNVTVPLLFHGISPTTVLTRFIVAFSSNRIATYAIKKISVIDLVKIDAKIIEKTNDIGNYIVYCSIKGSINGITVQGVINRNSKFIRSIKCQSKQVKALSAGQICSIVSFASEESETKAEPWRSSFFSNDKNESLALIFQFPEIRIPAQAPIRFVQKSYDTKLKIELPPIVKASLRIKSICKVWIVNPPQDKEDYELYITPMKILAGETGDDDTDCGEVAGCKWVGITKTKLCKNNNFTAEFSFVAFRLGIYHVSGFIVSENGNFVKRKEIKMMQSFRVDPA